MFSDNLSANVLYLCEAYNLSYAQASKKCSICYWHFRSIARGKVAPTIHTLEKLCNGFNVTPNDLLFSRPPQQIPSPLRPLPVTQIRCYQDTIGLTGFPVCPRCQSSLEREYQSFCDRCGQCLDWRNFSQATLLLPGKTI